MCSETIGSMLSIYYIDNVFRDNWEYALNLLCRQCVQRNVVNELVHVLKTPVGQGGCGQGGCGQGGCGQGGCGLKNVAINILDHYHDENKRFNKLSYRLIGSQAILLAKYGLRAVDVLQTPVESELEKMYHSVTSKFFESLRHAGVLANRVLVDNTYPKAISKICTLYFNLYAFFPR